MRFMSSAAQMAAYMPRSRSSLSDWRKIGPFLASNFAWGALYEVRHGIGLHTFRDCWEARDGYRRFRGNRCVICDDPWSPV